METPEKRRAFSVGKGEVYGVGRTDRSTVGLEALPATTLPNENDGF